MTSKIPKGAIYKRPNRPNHYARCWWLKEQGREHRISLKTVDKGMAEARFLQLQERYIKGETSPDKALISSIFTTYLDEYSANPDNVIPKNHQTNRTRLNTIKEYFTNHNINRIDQLNNRHIEGLKNFLRDKLNKSPRTVNHYIELLRSVFNIAVSWNLISHNPIIISSKLPNAARPATVTLFKKHRFLTVDEVKIVLDTAPNDLRPQIILMLNTGLRLKEMMYLQWKDVDMSNKGLAIQSKDEHSPKARRLDHIPLNEAAIQLLRSIPQNGEFVFPQNLTANIYTKRLRKLLESTGLYEKGSAVHIYRHTYISHLLINGVSPRIVMELARIKDMKTLMRYSHLSPHHKQQAIESIRFGI